MTWPLLSSGLCGKPSIGIKSRNSRSTSSVLFLLLFTFSINLPFSGFHCFDLNSVHLGKAEHLQFSVVTLLWLAFPRIFFVCQIWKVFSDLLFDHITLFLTHPHPDCSSLQTYWFIPISFRVVTAMFCLAQNGAWTSARWFWNMYFCNGLETGKKLLLLLSPLHTTSSFDLWSVKLLTPFNTGCHEPQCRSCNCSARLFRPKSKSVYLSLL